MSKDDRTHFIEVIKQLLLSAKERAVTAINIAMVYTYYEIGRRIVNEEQNGKSRAEYGKEIIVQLSIELTKEFGRGYSIRNLWLIRRFYLVYSNVEIPQSLIAQSYNYHKTTDGKVFFLRCFVVIDLKIGQLKHQDIGQMQMYINYFDRFVKTPEENKTIGILLCKDKNASVVELTLPEDNNQIFASEYEINLPSKEQLKNLLEDK